MRRDSVNEFIPRQVKFLGQKITQEILIVDKVTYKLKFSYKLKLINKTLRSVVNTSTYKKETLWSQQKYSICLKCPSQTWLVKCDRKRKMYTRSIQL
jgi:hypothetical protein